MHNFPKGKSVVCNQKHTLEQIKEILHLCIDNEVKIYGETIKTPIDTKYPYLMFNGDEICQTTRIKVNYPNDLYVSLEEFKAFIQGKGKYTGPFTENIELNSDYTATITKESIKVGCQEFSHDKIKELYQLSQKALKAKI